MSPAPHCTTRQAQSTHLHDAAEAERVARIAQLRDLAPPHPTELLAQYEAAALAFEAYQVQIRAYTGQGGLILGV